LKYRAEMGHGSRKRERKMKRTLPILTLIAFVLGLGMTGCRKAEEPQPEAVAVEQEQPVIEEEEPVVQEPRVAEEAAEEPVVEEDPGAFQEGFVTFLSGDAEVRHAQEQAWLVLDVDDSVIGNDRVKTGQESFCEVQFTEFGIIRIQQETEVLLKSIFLKEEKNKVRVKLDKGNLLCKIDKLSKGEEFQVETGTVLAGVRGTEFMVREIQGGKTVVAVNEGSVAVVPSEIAEKITLIEADLQTETAREVLKEVTASEIMVTDQKELVIEPQQVEEAVRKFEESAPSIEKKIREIDKKAVSMEKKEQILEAKPEERTARNLREVEVLKDDIRVMKEDMTSSTQEVNAEIKDIIERVEPVSTSSKRELNDIREMRPLGFVVASKLVEREKKSEPSGPVYSKVTIEVEPRDARIFVDGRDAGRGTFSGLYESGTRIRVRVVRQGYKTAERVVVVPALEKELVSIRLESPVVWRYRKEGDYFVRKPVLSGTRIVLASAAGELLCLGEKGEKMWSVSTANHPNENSMPVLAAQGVLFSGLSELVMVELETGEIIRRMALPKDQYPAHLFGSPSVPFGQSILFPASDRLLLLDGTTLRQQKSIPIEESGLGSPSAYGDRLVTVNERGELLLLDPANGSVELRLETGAFQMVGSSPSVVGSRVVFGDNAGTVVAADVEQRQVLWEKRIGTGGAKALYQDMVVGGDAVYPFTGEALYAFSLDEGRELFESVHATCNPLFREGMLYFGDPDSSLVMMDGKTGRILKRYSLDSPITLMPAWHEGNLVVATRSGTVYMIEAEHL
jgi:outer membrane protein assembly factor BamB